MSSTKENPLYGKENKIQSEKKDTVAEKGNRYFIKPDGLIVPYQDYMLNKKSYHES